MNSQVGRDMVSLGKRRHRALVPAAGQTQVVASLTPDMVVSDVLVEQLGIVKVLETRVPLADVVVREDEGLGRWNAVHAANRFFFWLFFFCLCVFALDAEVGESEGCGSN